MFLPQGYFDREVNADGISPEEYGPEPRAPGEQDLIDFEVHFSSQFYLSEVILNFDFFYLYSQFASQF